jgi:fibronectin-binding autotransporter adhesin
VAATPARDPHRQRDRHRGEHGHDGRQLDREPVRPEHEAITVDYATADGDATTGSDYQGASGTLTFAPGETTKTITIVVNGDSKKEADETFFVDLFGNSSNSLFTKNRGVGTILNDD